MKHRFKVISLGDEIHTGTIDSCIKAAKKQNEKAGDNVCIIEIWELSEQNGWFWVHTLPDFWS